MWTARMLTIMEELEFSLSINKGEFEDFSISLAPQAFNQLKDIYLEESAKEDFDDRTFWPYLKAKHSDLSKVITEAIAKELSRYIFEDGLYGMDNQRPDNCFPLCDLYFDYLTANGEKTMRHLNCEKCVIYDRNEYDCDFTGSFD